MNDEFMSLSNSFHYENDVILREYTMNSSSKQDKNRQHSSHETAPKPLIDLLETFPFFLLEKVEL